VHHEDVQLVIQSGRTADDVEMTEGRRIERTGTTAMRLFMPPSLAGRTPAPSALESAARPLPDAPLDRRDEPRMTFERRIAGQHVLRGRASPRDQVGILYDAKKPERRPCS
jgi:hypothetical protein